MNIDYVAMFDEEPPKDGAYKSVARTPIVPDLSDDFGGSSTGAGIPLEKQVEHEQWIEELVPGVAYTPIRKESSSTMTILVDEFFKDFSAGQQFTVPDTPTGKCNCACDKCKSGTCADCTMREKCASCIAQQKKETAVKSCTTKADLDALDAMMLKAAGIRV